MMNINNIVHADTDPVMRVFTQTCCACTFCQRQSVKRHFLKTSNFALNCVTSGQPQQPPVKVRSPEGHRLSLSSLLLSFSVIQGTMARAEWDTVTDNSVKETRDIKNSGGKTVRFLASSSDNAQCDNRVKNREAGSPALGMVQGLVPHLPGLEKDKVYVISGRSVNK